MPEEAIFLTSCTVQIYSTWMDNMLWKDVSNCGFFGSIFTLIHIFVSTLFRTFELNYANYVLQDIPQEMEPLQKDTFYLHFSFSRQNSFLPQTFPIFGEAFAQDHNIDSDCNWRRWRLPASFSFQTSQPLGHRLLFGHRCRKWLFLSLQWEPEGVFQSSSTPAVGCHTISHIHCIPAEGYWVQFVDLQPRKRILARCKADAFHLMGQLIAAWCCCCCHKLFGFIFRAYGIIWRLSFWAKCSKCQSIE